MRPRAAHLALSLAALALLAFRCRDTPPPPAPTAKAIVPPACALAVAENPSGGAKPGLLLALRRGPPAEARWDRLITGHKPEAPVGSPDFAWPFIRDYKELALPLDELHSQVHDLLIVLPPGGPSTLMMMTQGTDSVWSAPMSFVGTSNIVPSGKPGGPLGADLGRSAIFKRVSAAAIGGKLHICAVEEQGQLERNVLDPATSRFTGWTDIERSGGTETGSFVDVACATVRAPDTGAEQLHVCGVTGDGHLWHSVETSRDVFTAFGDVEAQAGEVGDFARVDCAGHQGQLALVGLTRDGKAWHTLRIPQRWRAFESVEDQAPPAAPPVGRVRDLAAGYCNAEVPPDGPRDVGQLNVVLTADSGGQARIWHAIRANNPVVWSPGAAPSNWRPLEDLAPRINRTPASPVPPVTEPFLWAGFSVGPRPMWPY